MHPSPAPPSGRDASAGLRRTASRADARWLRLKRALLDLVYPPACVGLGCGRAGAWLCPRCEALIVPAPVGRLRDLVTAPLSDSPSLGRVFAVGYYDPPLSDAVRALKYGRRSALAPFLAALMSANAPDWPRCARIVPVPAHPSRVGARGIDHARLLAAELASMKGLRSSRALVRDRDTASQTGLNRVQRRQNVEGAFRAVAGLEGQHVVLVDDVLTTGATALACSEALIAAGAERVDLGVVAIADRWAG